MLTRCPSFVRLAATAAMVVAASSLAQCPTPTWLPGSGVPGIRGLSEWYAYSDGQVNAAVMWDPDGAGPLTPRLVVAGVFQFAGDKRAKHIAMWDGTTWSSLGDGIGVYEPGAVNDQVYALAVAPNGHLIVGGYFMEASGVPANNVVEWTGTAWAPLGGGIDGPVLSLTVRANGHILAGGQFATVEGVRAANCIARWDGTQWNAIGQGLRVGVDIGSGDSLTALANGDIIVSGYFDHAGTIAASNIARLRFGGNGTSFNWFALGSGTDGEVNSTHLMPNGDVIAGGSFGIAGGVAASGIAKWNGSVWSAISSGMTAGLPVLALTHLNDGSLIAAGPFNTAGGLPSDGVARWDGTAWSNLSGFADYKVPFSGNIMSALTMPDGSLVVSGEVKGGALKWNGAAWSHLGNGFDSHPADMGVLSNGDLLVTGNFRSTPGSAVSGTDVRDVARFNGTSWSSLGSGPGYSPSTFVEMPNHDIITAGAQVPAGGGTAARLVSRWNGSTWSTLSTGFSAYDLAALPNGDLIAAGRLGATSGVYRWDGAAWQILGGPFLLSTTPTFGAPVALAVLTNGDIIAGGSFDLANGVTAYNVARWDGAQWNPMAFGLGNPYPNLFENVTALAVLPNGNIAAVGNFTYSLGNPLSFNNTAVWNGTEWQGMGAGRSGLVAFDVVALPDGRVVVGGSLEEPVSIWDGAAWTVTSPNANGTVFALAALPNGNVAVGGTFTFAGNSASAYFAELCPGPAPTLCVADVDDGTATGTPDGGVTIDDLLYYLVIFEQGDVTADVDDGSSTGTHDGGVTIDDLLYFLLRFEAGC